MKSTKLILFVCLTLISLVANAGLDILSRRQILTLIGEFPTQGSQAEFLDDEVLLKYQTIRTEKDCSLASEQSKLKIKKVFVKPGGPLEIYEYNRVRFSLLKLKAKMGLNIMRAKRLFNRPRPYERNPEIIPCVSLERSSSYPSGHSAMGRAVGRFLADRYPDKAEEIMAVANQVGTNRVLGGVHHLSDVVAGQKLGDVIAERMIISH